MALYKIETVDPSAEFLSMRQAAGRHIQSFFQDGLQSWLKVDPCPPFLEHLSFRVGNQVFFIRLEDIEERAQVPGSRDGLLHVADGWNGQAIDWIPSSAVPMISYSQGFDLVDGDSPLFLA